MTESDKVVMQQAPDWLTAINELYEKITPLPWFRAADGRGLGLSGNRWTMNGGFSDVCKKSVSRHGGTHFDNIRFIGALANAWPIIRAAIAQPVESATQKLAYICQGCGGLYWAKVDCDCNTKAAFDLVAVSNIAQPVEPSLTEASKDAAVNTLLEMGYTYLGKAEWKPPAAQPVEQATQQNFCHRCGKRLGSIDDIHTCTPVVQS